MITANELKNGEYYVVTTAQPRGGWDGIAVYRSAVEALWEAKSRVEFGLATSMVQTPLGSTWFVPGSLEANEPFKPVEFVPRLTYRRFNII